MPEHSRTLRPTRSGAGPRPTRPASTPAGPLRARTSPVPVASHKSAAGSGPRGTGKPAFGKGKPSKPYGPPRQGRFGSGPSGPRSNFGGGGPGGGGFGGGGGGGGGRTGTRLPADVRVVHDDDDLIVIDKPAGLLTANLPGEDRPALFDMLKDAARARARRVKPVRGPEGASGAPATSRGPGRRAMQKVFIIHRLDKEASGLLVFALSEKAFGWLKDDFKAKRVHRIYHAVLEGEMGKVGDAGTIQSFLRERNDGMVESIKPEQFRGAQGDESDAKPAVTHYRVLAIGQGRTLVQVRLETGRKNQIRAHMAERGHPLVGDYRFGAKTDPLRRLCLHASELGFTHPGNGQTVRFRSAAAGDFFRLVGAKPPVVTEATITGTPPTTTTPTTATPAAAPPAAAPAKPAHKAASKAAPAGREIDTSWNGVAGWYDAMLSPEQINDHYRDVIIPGTVRLVQPGPGVRVLDVACGQGVIARALADLGASVLGTDAAPALVDAARTRAGGGGGASGPPAPTYHTMDARTLDQLPGVEPSAAPGSFDAATCVMALTNIDPIEPVFRGIAGLLKPGGRFVAVMSHPAFRAPGQTAWGWDDKAAAQYRRVDGYLSSGQHAIDMHPGKAAAGAKGGEAITWTFHRPLQTYARLLGESGLLIETIEEWAGRRQSEPGPRADAENRARREIPLFIAIRCVRV